MADDVAQDVFLSVYRNIGSYRAEARFSTWLLAIAHNALRQALRGRSRLERLRERLFREPAEDTEHPLESPARRLHAALARLEPDERSVVVLSHMHDLSHSEIAALTQLPLGSVKSHAARGKARLREMLTEEATRNGS